MLFNNYKYKPNQQLNPIELGTPSYLDTIGANVLSAPTDLAAFLTSFVPSDPNVKDVNVFQQLRKSIQHVRDNPEQTTPQKVVGSIAWLVGSIPGFGIATKSVRAGSGLLGISAKSTLAKSLEGGLAWGVSNYPTNVVSSPEDSVLQKTGRFAEDVVLGATGEYAIRSLIPKVVSSLTKSNKDIEDIGLNPSITSQESLNYSLLHEAARHTELSNPNVLGDTHAESIIEELQQSSKLNDILNNVSEEDKPFYETLKNYKPNVDINALDNQLYQMSSGDFNKVVPSPAISTRDEFIEQFHYSNLDETIPEEYSIKKQLDNKNALEDYINCKMGG